MEELAKLTAIDRFFLDKIAHIVQIEKELSDAPFDAQVLKKAKYYGFGDKAVALFWNCPEERVYEMRMQEKLFPVYKAIDSCASEFDAYIPYFYSTYAGEENESRVGGQKKKVVVLGAGPIRIGQGVEFDYSTVHAIKTIKSAGYEAIIINNNPETVSTDYTTSDKLYFEPLTVESVLDILRLEQPEGVIASLGGQTAINLAGPLAKYGVKIIGTDCAAIDRAENRDLFEKLLTELGIPEPKGRAVTKIEEGVEAAEEIGYPVLVRPSFVLGGRAMQIVTNEESLRHYLKTAVEIGEEKPVLVDRYISGKEVEVDAICDGRDVFVPGIMELVERTGIHSGDSISVYPPFSISDRVKGILLQYTKRLGLAIGIVGLFNIQFIVDKQEQVYIIEVNPRSSRTVPFLSKATGYALPDIATRVMLGEKLKDMPYGTGLAPISSYTAIKVPVFSFEKLSGLDTQLGPEMKSTGEVLGIAPTMREALYKGLVGAGYQLTDKGGIFITVRDTDKDEIPDIAQRFADLGFHLYATAGTAAVLRDHGMSVTLVHKISESEHNTIALLESGKVNYIISTSKKGRTPARDSVKVRRKSVELGIPCLTSLDTAVALADILKSGFTPDTAELVDICTLQK